MELTKWTKPIQECKKINYAPTKKRKIRKVVIKMCELCTTNQAHGRSQFCLDCLVERNKW